MINNQLVFWEHLANTYYDYVSSEERVNGFVGICEEFKETFFSMRHQCTYKELISTLESYAILYSADHDMNMNFFSGDFWWPIGDYWSRLVFLEWIIEQEIHYHGGKKEHLC